MGLFQNWFVTIEEYDGFENPRSMALNKVIVCVRVLKLPKNYLSDTIVRGMCQNTGEIFDVQIQLSVGYAGAFVWLRVKMDRFVSITKG